MRYSSLVSPFRTGKARLGAGSHELHSHGFTFGIGSRGTDNGGDGVGNEDVAARMDTPGLGLAGVNPRRVNRSENGAGRKEKEKKEKEDKKEKKK